MKKFWYTIILIWQYSRFWALNRGRTAFPEELNKVWTESLLKKELDKEKQSSNDASN